MGALLLVSHVGWGWGSTAWKPGLLDFALASCVPKSVQFFWAPVSSSAEEDGSRSPGNPKHFSLQRKQTQAVFIAWPSGAFGRVHCSFWRVHCTFGMVHCTFGRVHCTFGRVHCSFWSTASSNFKQRFSIGRFPKGLLFLGDNSPMLGRRPAPKGQVVTC